MGWHALHPHTNSGNKFEVAVGSGDMAFWRRSGRCILRKLSNSLVKNIEKVDFFDFGHKNTFLIFVVQLQSVIQVQFFHLPILPLPHSPQKLVNLKFMSWKRIIRGEWSCHHPIDDKKKQLSFQSHYWFSKLYLGKSSYNTLQGKKLGVNFTL